MNSRRLGSSGPEVSRVGLGCKGMSGVYGRADRATSVATIGEAELELGEDEVAAIERRGHG